MTFLAPLFFAAALGMASVVVALHFIVTRQPPSRMLPTTRFVPERTVRAPSRAVRPEDLLLLLLRVLLVLVVGAAFARPVLVPPKRMVARIILLDVSRDIRDRREVGDSARALYRRGDAVIVFDSGARSLGGAIADSLAHLRQGSRSARLSPAFVAALRAAPLLRASADSLEMVIVSPMMRHAMDEATMQLRALWPGRITLKQVAAHADSSQSSVVSVRAHSDDPVAVASALLRKGNRGPLVRLVRGALASDDTVWARDSGHVLVHWPAEVAPFGSKAGTTVDTVGAVAARSSVVVAPFERRWRFDRSASSSAVAHWIDGDPAAVERSVGAGCVRGVAIPVTGTGDLILSPGFVRLLTALTDACGGGRRLAVLSPAQRATLAGTGGLAPSSLIRPPDVTASPIVPWLLALALLLAAFELFARRAGKPTDVVA